MENFSQFCQDLHIINNIFDKKENGYFVDIGAYDGINMSNTYLLEKNYGWKGICIEANPRYFNKLLETRKSININKAIYKNDYEELDFIDDINGGCSGLEITNSHGFATPGKNWHKIFDRHGFLNDCPIIKVKTKNLTTLLEEHNAPNFIEYLSIDTEGSEFDILNCHNFEKYKFGYITVEHNFIHVNRMKIRNLLYNKGYIHYRENGVDDDYILKLKGIFYNSKKAVCSIYESGLMVYNCLKKSNLYTLDYTEERQFLDDYDFAIVNEHFTVNNWITEQIVIQFNKPVFCIVTEVSFSEKYIEKSPSFYTAYIVLDSSINEKNNIYGFPRPLEDYIVPTFIESSIPIIGSFGFATPGKNWHKIIEETQKNFEEAIVRFNIPFATYVPNYEKRINEVLTSCNSILTNSKIKLEVTHNNYTKEELISWCAQNTINCFLYDREHIFSSGLCATTDQAIVSGKPLLISKDCAFRHIHKYIDFYPNISIKQAIQQTQNGVKKMKNDWSSNKFLNKFHEVLFKFLHIKDDKQKQKQQIKHKLLFDCEITAYYHVNNYNETGNVTDKVYNLLNNFIEKDEQLFSVCNNIFSDTCINQVKTLFINLTKDDITITNSYIENSNVNLNDIIRRINELFNEPKINENHIEVSIGEIIDKYSILELKKKYITNVDKLYEIQKEIKVLDEKVLDEKVSHFYKLLLHINEQIWLDTDKIKTIKYDNTNEKIFANISNEIFENNQKRFRLKNYFNVLKKSNINEQKSYSENNCLINISSENDIYDKIPEINYLCISYDTIYFKITYKKIINNLFKNPNIFFVENNYSNIFETIELTGYKIKAEFRDCFDFEPIKYKSGGKLGDFLNQLSVVCEKFYETGRKSELYIFNLDCQADQFPYGLEYTYKDTYNSIISQIFIKDYKIYNNEIVDFDLSSWRSNLVLDNWYNIYKKNYNVDWGKHKWLTGNYDPKWSNKIIINITPYRFMSSNAITNLLEKVNNQLDNCVFVSNEKEHYDFFLNKTNLKIEFYQPINFEEVVTIINSCKMAYLGFSGNAVISNSLHKNHTIIGKYGGDYILNNLKGIIPHVIDVLI
jgi:FkbM family methyltransferase